MTDTPVPEDPIIPGWDSAPVEAERVQGGSFGGEAFTSGEYRTSDGLPGQVILSDEGYVEPGSQARYPGIRIIPVDSSELVTPPGIGPNENGFIITGGRNTTGGRGYSIYSPNAATMSFVKGGVRSNVAVNDRSAWIDTADENGNKGEVQARSTFGSVKAVGADGAAGLIQAMSSSAMVLTNDPGGNMMSRIMSNGREASLWSTGSDGLGRILSVDSDGVWVKVQRGDGTWKQINLEGSAWSTLSLLEGWTAYTGGDGYYQGLRAQRTPLGIRVDGMVKGGAPGSVIAVLPDDMQDVAAKHFTGVTSGYATAYLSINPSPAHGGKFVVTYNAGPPAPTFVSVFTDAALL